MTSDTTQALLKQRRSRVVAEIMGGLERSSAWKVLSKDEREDIRDGVIDGVNSYHDLALDILKVYSDGTVLISEQAVRMIADIHASRP